MTKRKSYYQNLHNGKIRQLAAIYKHNGWKVRADLKGYEKPSPINRKIPDIVARKGKRVVIIEVETPETIKTDKAQQETFRKYAQDKPGVEFKIIVAKSKKRKPIPGGKLEPSKKNKKSYAGFKSKKKLYENIAAQAISNVYARYPKDRDIDLVLLLAKKGLAVLKDKPKKEWKSSIKRRSIFSALDKVRRKK